MKIILFVVSILAVLVVVVSTSAPHYLKDKIESAINNSCKNCGLKIGGLQIDFFQNQIVATDVWFHNDQKDTVAIKAHVAKAMVDVMPAAFFRAPVIVGKVSDRK